MSEAVFPTPQVPVESIEPATLKDRIEANEPVTILDVRAQSEFAEWHIDGVNVEIVNVPYFEFLGEVDDDVLDVVPHGDPVVVICAKGDSSEFIAGLLMKELDMPAVNLAEGMNGWASIYEAIEIENYAGEGTLYQYQRPSSGCLGYLLVSDGEAAVVDPLRAFADRYIADVEGADATLEYAIDTHVHADHISGIRELDEMGVTGVIPAAAVDRGVVDHDAFIQAADGDEFRVGDAVIETVFTPGHTSGMTSYLIEDSVLLTGDGLFTESIARPDLEKGDEGAPEAAQQLYDSLQERVLQLDDDVIIAGAHFSDAADPADDGTYTATIGKLTADMEALSMAKDDFVDLILADMPPRPANYEEIIATNLGQQQPGEDEAFRLELGPNNCAASQEALTGD